MNNFGKQFMPNTGNQGTATAQQLEVENLAKISVDEPEMFGATFETKYMQTQEICKKVNELFRGVVGDYFGSTLLPNPSTGMLELSLFLKDQGETNKVKAIEPIVQQTINNQFSNPGERIKRLNNRNSGRTLQLTADGKSIFEDFIYRNNPNQKVDWNRYCAECSEQTTIMGKYNIYIRLFNLDIVKVLSAIYGDKTPEGSSYEYKINIERVAPNQLASPVPNNFIVRIDRFNNHNIEVFAAKVGLMPTVGTYNIVQ